MTKAAITKIEKQALDLRTQVVGMGLLSADAKMFLESLAPVEEWMRALDFGEIERSWRKSSSCAWRIGGGCRAVSEMIEAPWIDEQVANLNRWQQAGYVHEFICPNDHEDSRVLIAAQRWLALPELRRTQTGRTA